MLILCHGCFDLIHIGHLKYLEAARELGTQLIVTITADQYINKGPGRPLFNEQQRLQMLQALRCVDHAEILYEPTAVTGILKHRPDIYAKGQDYQDKSDFRLEREKLALQSYGGKLSIIQTEKWSSTEIMSGQLLKDRMLKYSMVS